MGRRLVDVIVGAVLLVAAYFALFGGEYTLFELREMDALEERHKASLARTEAEIEGLRRRAHELKTDPRAIERVSRERYGMIRDGEILYRFRDPAARDTSATSPTETGER